MKKRHEAPASVWSEEELLDGKRVRCLTIILSTPGCAWWRDSGGCIMCGYNEKASDRSITGENILSQFEVAWKSFDNQSIVKVYTSGSFIDENEVPSNAREEILNRVKGSGAKMLFESRPEFVKPETIKECAGICPDIEVALGLESANDRILSKSISKGFTFADYEGAAKAVLAAGATVRTYLLLKPPFLTEQEAIDDTLQSISKAAPYSRVITVNPVNVQRRTRLEKLWKNWAYRPPWLWSVIEVLNRAEAGDSLLFSSMVGAGSDHGPHNCGTCDSDFISSIDGFNLTQDRKKLDRCDCGCRSRWQETLLAEKFAISTGDHEKFFLR
jgi:radical SAM enzyme (TIGR01210 family)